MGYAYFLGKGISKNESKAVQWFQKSAEQGNAEAKRMLGALYLDGIGVSQDINKGCALTRELAERGDELAIDRYNRRCVK